MSGERATRPRRSRLTGPVVVGTCVLAVLALHDFPFVVGNSSCSSGLLQLPFAVQLSVGALWLLTVIALGGRPRLQRWLGSGATMLAFVMSTHTVGFCLYYVRDTYLNGLLHVGTLPLVDGPSCYTPGRLVAVRGEGGERLRIFLGVWPLDLGDALRRRHVDEPTCDR